MATEIFNRLRLRRGGVGVKADSVANEICGAKLGEASDMNQSYQTNRQNTVPHYSVILANAGIHRELRIDSRFHGNDSIELSSSSAVALAKVEGSIGGLGWIPVFTGMTKLVDLNEDQ